MTVTMTVTMVLCQPEKLKPEAGVKAPGAANVNIGMTLVSTKNLAKMGSKVFAAPVRSSFYTLCYYSASAFVTMFRKTSKFLSPVFTTLKLSLDIRKDIWVLQQSQKLS